ncbi:hypothetical protein BC830DRAFT_1123554 [Chytriomyces sp. MP71]|nr:hypothetical protein BC830DRAFT_1123554 [Chytriomyces sp. MP71]
MASVGQPSLPCRCGGVPGGASDGLAEDAAKKTQHESGGLLRKAAAMETTECDGTTLRTTQVPCNIRS